MSMVDGALELWLNSEAETDQLAAVMMSAAPDRGVVLLRGTLGAGKTRLVRGMGVAIGVDPELVVSPTFVLCQTYHGARTLHHLDAYRLNDDDEFLELGVDELMDDAAITLVEWGDKVVACLPPDRLEVALEIKTDTARLASIVGLGENSAAWQAAIKAEWGEVRR